jgi:hypothetical protein
MTWLDRLRSARCDTRGELVHVVEATAALLRVANDRPDETRADRRNAELNGAVARLEASLHDLLDRVTSEFLDTEMLLRIASTLDATSLRHGLAALSAATTIDAHLGARFIDYFRGRNHALQPGDPVPVVPFPSTTLPVAEQRRVLTTLGRRTGNPSFRTVPDDRVSRLRLAPAEVTG